MRYQLVIDATRSVEGMYMPLYIETSGDMVR